MLEHLYIESVALIDKVNIDFGKGLNILSGETGAGKSIIIDSIGFVSGERPGKDFISRNAEKAVVEALMFIDDDFVINEIKDMGIVVDDDNSILISRTVNVLGKTSCKINGKTVTVSMLKEIVAMLIDIHGQHEHQSLLNPSKHIVILDRFCGDKIMELKSLLAEKYKLYKEILKNISEIDGDKNERTSKIEMYQFQIDEIKAANFKENEEEDLVNRRKVLNNAEKLKDCSNEALELLYRSENGSAAEKISLAVDNLYRIAEMDSEKKKLCSDLEAVSVQLEDVVSELSSYNDGIECDRNELNFIEERLDMLYRMKRKYGGTIKEILAYLDNISRRLDFILNSEEELAKLTEKKRAAENSIRKVCDAISKERKKYAVHIQTQIENILKDLGMKDAVFKIDIQKKEEFNTNGRDKVEFLISPNPGEELKPLAKIASGGEMSRVMLALKAVLADADTIETFIFDEIDTGVSGRTAQQVAQKLSDLGEKHQILCITHLPQIAAMGDNHFLIEKISGNDSARTTISKLNYDKIINELARLIGGAEITKATLKAAEEMKKLALNLK